jgi:DMSO/TMAO reductase YedYZ molybdopterin-dependent catalytic subunit
MKQQMNEPKEIDLSTRSWRKKSLLAFACLVLFFAVCIFLWKWVHRQPQIAGIPQPVRKVLKANEKVFSSVAFSPAHLEKEYPRSQAVKHVRVNGDIGLKSAFDTASWKLKVVRAPGDTLRISLAEIQALPKTEIIYNFKCIEGWSQITDWAGVRFSDFAKKYHLTYETKQNYAGLITPDGEYYVGIDMASMMHPQTLLCYELNGKPLPLNQGYPLRLIIPVKYGIKHLKRIGTLFFSNERPPDYWYERGYDYYSGL